MKSKTAILIFANSAQKEAELKSFGASEILFSELNRQTLATVKKTGLPYFQFSEAHQVGHNFGERFTNAIESIYALGYDNIITIGNDTPHLRAFHILRAAERLATDDVVLGPSRDGGFYLMGLRQSHFNKQQFLRLPWQTSHLNRSIFRLLSSKNTAVSYLERLTDIDTLSDAGLVLNSFKTLANKVKKLLHTYISDKVFIYEITIGKIQNFILDLQFNKGSPSVF